MEIKPLTAEEIASIERRHVLSDIPPQKYAAPSVPICGYCADAWPCDAIGLRATLRQAEAAREVAEQARDTALAALDVAFGGVADAEARAEAAERRAGEWQAFVAKVGRTASFAEATKRRAETLREIERMCEGAVMPEPYGLAPAAPEAH